jgi:predicted P-loop ATPase
MPALVAKRCNPDLKAKYAALRDAGKPAKVAIVTLMRKLLETANALAERDAIGRAEVSRIKAFLTRTTDRFRPPYGRYTVEVPRQCVFAGTVNPDTYLRDETGNRRFWPLRCGTIDIAVLARDRDQLWAEAVHRFREGAIWWIDDPALLAEAREEWDRRYQSDAWDDLIEHWLTHEIRTVSDGFPITAIPAPKACRARSR